ncbi:MAG TPA: hypothetical protein VK172_10445 [Lentimicrobium sp.]|nr:hypothetical protein [Lentimicrobium sp.]
MEKKKLNWHYFMGDVEIQSNNIDHLKEYVNAVYAKKLLKKDILNYKSVNIIGKGSDMIKSVENLKAYEKEVFELLKDKVLELPNWITDTYYAIETDYQAYHNLDQDNWDIVHKPYFEIVHQGYEKASDREEIRIHAGEHGNIVIYRDNDKLGFIVDVYGEVDHHDSMTVWEEDLEGEHEEGIDVEID